MQLDNDDEMLQSGGDFDNDDALEAEYYEEDDTELDDSDSEESQATDSAPDSETEHEAKGGDDARSSQKVEERIGELTRKRREAERLAEERQKELEKLQAQILDSQEPVIPDLPDPDEVSDREFQEAIKRRDKAIQEKIAWQQQKTHFDNTRQQQTQQQQLQRQQEMLKAAQTYTERASKLGIKNDELQQAAAVINQVGLNDDIAQHILADDLGPAITKHLGNNVSDLLEVAGSNPIRAALYIEQRIKPKLSPQKRKSRAPRPPSKVKGGTPDRNEKFPLTGGRAKFE